MTKMYCLLFLIVLVSLHGSGASNITTITNQNGSTETPNRTTAVYTSSQPPTKASTGATQTTSVSCHSASKEEICLFNIKNSKEMLFLLVIAVFSLFCLFLLITTLILLCKRRRSVRISSLVTNEQFNLINRNNADGGPSETMHIINDNPETAEADREEEVGGETAEANHMSTEGTDTPAPEATPTPEPDIAPPPEPEMPPPPEPEISGELV